MDKNKLSTEKMLETLDAKPKSSLLKERRPKVKHNPADNPIELPAEDLGSLEFDARRGVLPWGKH